MAEEVLASAHVTVTQPAGPCSVIMELATPVGEFCLTEVVVTEAFVEVDGLPGWGCVMGFDEHAGLAAAVVDGWAASDPTAGSTVDALCLSAEQVEREADDTARRQVRSTEIVLG